MLPTYVEILVICIIFKEKEAQFMTTGAFAFHLCKCT